MDYIRILKKVSSSANGNARIISLPWSWVTNSKDPRKVILFLGNIIILTSPEDEEKGQKAVEILSRAGIMESFTQDQIKRPKYQRFEEGLCRSYAST